ncbi:MAG: hypothetical protein AAF564_02280 [Bacteroidota bacterium]
MPVALLRHGGGTPGSGKVLVEIELPTQRLEGDVELFGGAVVGENVVRASPLLAETSLRLGKALGMSEKFWFNLQADYDFRIAKRSITGLTQIQPLVSPMP